MVKRIETEEDKVKLTLLIPKSVRAAIKEAAEAADESQSLFICTLLKLYRTLGSAAEPIATDIATVEVPALATIPSGVPAPQPVQPQVPRIGAMEQMEQSLDNRFGGQSEATRMLQMRLRKEQRTGSIERIHRESKAATEREE